MHTCNDTFHTAMTACRDDRDDCRAMCPPPPPPSSCDGAFIKACGRDLGTCAKNVVTQAKTCHAGCATADDKHTCLQGCAQTAESGNAACRNAFRTCVAPCRPRTPTTTLPQPPCGADSSSGACGGRCPHGLTCAPPPSESGSDRACVCRPPDGECAKDSDCDDGNDCSKDHCMAGSCEHVCVCADDAGSASCCSGPSDMCPPPAGRCFDTVDMQCGDDRCDPHHPCHEANEVCRAECAPSPTTTTTLPSGGCRTNADCDDSDGCTADHCKDGTCEHTCVCHGPSGACVRPCGHEAGGTCGGACVTGATCGPVHDGNECGCVSGAGGPCGGKGPAPVCGPGLVCKHTPPAPTGTCVQKSS